jgi:hypothetical protein
LVGNVVGVLRARDGSERGEVRKYRVGEKGCVCVVRTHAQQGTDAA